MTKRELQLEENNACLELFNSACREYYETERETKHNIKPRRLRSCTAKVFETENYYILQSYETLIAAVRKSDNALADALRHEYDYTATSAQHIAKFMHDYTPYPWNSARFTYRNI